VDGLRHLGKAAFGLAHQGHLAQARQGRSGLDRRSPVKEQAIDRLLQHLRRGVLGAGQVKRLPAQLVLLAQDGQGAEGVPTVQRDGVVQHMQDTHQARASAAVGMLGAATACVPSMLLRRKASNMSSVHSGEL